VIQSWQNCQKLTLIGEIEMKKGKKLIILVLVLLSISIFAGFENFYSVAEGKSISLWEIDKQEKEVGAMVEKYNLELPDQYKEIITDFDLFLSHGCYLTHEGKEYKGYYFVIYSECEISDSTRIPRVYFLYSLETRELRHWGHYYEKDDREFSEVNALLAKKK
jgi:hypothetical protein